MKRFVFKAIFLATLLTCFAGNVVNAETQDFTVEILPTITVKLAGASFTADGTFQSYTSTVEIMTNSETGYTSMLTTVYDSTDNHPTDLRHVAAGFYIPTLSESATETNFPTNHWGVSVDGVNYLPVPAKDESGVPLLSGDSPAASGIMNLYFGSKVETTNAAGVYKNTVMVTAVANPQPPTYMQDVADWGPDLENGESIRAVDIRDGKKYWVTKMPNGEIWMTQNLDFQISRTDGTYLTPDDTDVLAAKTIVGHAWSSDETNILQVDVGDYYFVDGITPAPIVDFSEDDERYHYDAGSYYSLAAALTGTNLSESICPKGWRLPNEKGTGSYTYGGLLASIGGSSSSDAAMRAAPVYLTRSGWSQGYQIYNAGSNMEVGKFGYYRVRVDELSWITSIYTLSNTFSKDGYSYPDQGVPVRCVAR